MPDAPKMLALVGVGITVASYLCKEWIEAIERAKSALDKELGSYRDSSHHQTTQLNLLSQRAQLEILQRQTSSNINYKNLIIQDTVVLKQAEALVREASEDLSHLIEKLVFGSASVRQQFEKVQPKVVANESEATSEKSSRELDWTDAAKVKLAVVSTVVGGLPELFFGDTVITLAKKQVKFLNSVVGVGRWAVRILFVVGACLTVYSITKGIKVGGGSE